MTECRAEKLVRKKLQNTKEHIKCKTRTVCIFFSSKLHNTLNKEERTANEPSLLELFLLLFIIIFLYMQKHTESVRNGWEQPLFMRRRSFE